MPQRRPVTLCAPCSANKTNKGTTLDRREFIVSAAAVSVGVCAEGLAAAGQSFAALQRALTAGVVTSEALTQAYLQRIARFDQPLSGYRSVLALNPDAL